MTCRLIEMPFRSKIRGVEKSAPTPITKHDCLEYSNKAIGKITYSSILRNTSYWLTVTVREGKVADSKTKFLYLRQKSVV